jgi:hypothetical protein
MRQLSADLTAAGYQCSEIDNWRDCGWSVVCRRASTEIEVVVAEIPIDAWMLQVRPYYRPGPVGRCSAARGLQRPATFTS